MKICSLITWLLIAASVAMSQQNVELRVGSGSVQLGQTVSVPIWIAASSRTLIPRSILSISPPQGCEIIGYSSIGTRFSDVIYYPILNMQPFSIALDTLGEIEGTELLGTITFRNSADNTTSSPIVVNQWRILTDPPFDAPVTNGFLTAQFNGQLTLMFRRVVCNFPTIELYYDVICDGLKRYNLTKQNFRIFENGQEIKEFELWNPSQDFCCPVSLSLVLDMSSSQTTASMKESNRVIRDVFSLLKTQDEAFLTRFDSGATSFPPDADPWLIIDLLRSMKSGVASSKPPALYEGVKEGIQNLMDNGQSQCRALLLFSPGWDSVSANTLSDVITLAIKSRIRIFTIGVGDNVNENELRSLADMTGGRFLLNPDKQRIQGIYDEISSITLWSWGNIITYTSHCGDGTRRLVDLFVQNVCMGTDVKSKSYKSIYDPQSFSQIPASVGKISVDGWSDFLLPITLSSSDTVTFPPFSMTFSTDMDKIKFKALRTEGTFLEGKAITISKTDSLITISVLDSVSVTGPGVLFFFLFQAQNPTGGAVVPVIVDDVSMTSGCVSFNVESGEVTIIHNPTGVAAVLRERSLVLHQNYPNPFSLSGPPAVIVVDVPDGSDTKISLVLFDALGREAATLYEGIPAPGSLVVRIDRNSLPQDIGCGTFFYRLRTSFGIQTRGIVITE